MATEILYADSHITGNVSSPNNALNAPDGTFTTDSGNTSWTSRWSMGNPSAVVGGTQTITVTYRKDAAGGGTPTITVNLYENGSLIRNIIATTDVLSEVSSTLQGTFESTEISNEQNVEIEIVVSGNGGGPNGRGAQVDAIRWDAYVPLIVTESIIISQSVLASIVSEIAAKFASLDLTQNVQTEIDNSAILQALINVSQDASIDAQNLKAINALISLAQSNDIDVSRVIFASLGIDSTYVNINDFYEPPSNWKVKFIRLKLK
jgi:hypothetical protein